MAITKDFISSRKTPNIVFVVIDALRADHLGCYGYQRATSPNIDELAGRGVFFENAYACINATDPSLTSIFSGLYPNSHGIINHGERVQQEEIQAFIRNRPKLLAELLKLEGYSTLALDFLDRWHKIGYDYYSGQQKKRIEDYGNQIVNRLPKVLQSLIRSTYRFFFADYGNNATNITKQAANLIKQNRDRSFLLFIHYWDTHTPYNAPKRDIEHFYEEANGIEINEILNSINNLKQREYFRSCTKGARTASEIIARYNGAIAFVDREIKRLVKTLQKCGILDKTLVIVTADHGESLTEHGIYFDHHGLYEPSIHVPLIFSYPGVLPKGKRVSAFVQHVDLVPTILDLLGIDIDHELDGKSLLPLISGEVEQLHSEVYIEESDTQRKRAIRTRDYKYSYSLTAEDAVCRYCGRIHGGHEELYDLNEDPGETQNIAEQRPDILASLKRRLFDWLEYANEKKIIKEKVSKLKNSRKI